MYIAVLEKTEPERRLYLAVSVEAFEELSEMDTFGLVVERFDIGLLIVRIEEEVIARWKT